jgi:hypothetical protein
MRNEFPAHEAESRLRNVCLHRQGSPLLGLVNEKCLSVGEGDAGMTQVPLSAPII